MVLQYQIDNHILQISLSGDYLSYDDNTTKEHLVAQIIPTKVQKIIIEASQLQKWDSTILALLLEIIKTAQAPQIAIQYQDFPDNLSRLITLAQLVDRKPELSTPTKQPFIDMVGSWGINISQDLSTTLLFIRQTFNSFIRLCKRTAVMRQIDFMFALEECSYKAIGIVSLVSFMVGLILAFVGAIQLKNFGAQIYVASLVAIGMTRIMGAIMVGIIMAGRTGASYAATIGTMQVNEEIDALKTMGIPIQDFLVLPRITALTLSIPLLTILADFMGILGGAAVGIGMLNISASEYWHYSVTALTMKNFMVGLFHSVVFGIIISLCGCYYGINCGRNADSVGKSTTQAVVSSIVWMIVATGFITLMFEVLGL